MEADTMAPITKSPLDSMRGRGGKYICRVRFTPKSQGKSNKIIEKYEPNVVRFEIVTHNRVETCLTK